MTTKTGLEVAQDGNVMRFTIHRPTAKNAIDEALASALDGAFTRAGKQNDVHCVVLQSTGDVFLSGGDLNALSQLPLDARGAQAVIALGARLRAIEACPVPVIAAVHGSVYGGGCELLVMTDIVVMDERATINFVHRKMGLVPAWGGCTRLIERVGAARAADILLTARPVGAAEAVEIGLASRLAPAGAVPEMVNRVATEIAQAPREALVAIKRSLLGSRRASRGEALDRELKSFREAWGSQAHQAAMQRFLSR